MLVASPAALRAEVSNAELAKEIAELKAQIRSLKGGVAEARRASRGKVVAAPAPTFVPPPTFAALPPGATPVYATVDKKLQFGALTITPGGYFAAEAVFRSRNQGRELDSSPTSIPFGAAGNINETRFSGRGTRAALLVEAPISKSNIVAGYAEIDFQQVGVGSNYTQSSSFVPRARHLYATLDNSDYGLHVLAGQAFSLATINSKGITPRNEALPAVIDYNYNTGFVYKRQAQIRVVKDFDKKLWLALSVENPQPTYAGCTPGINGTAIASTSGVTCQFTGVGSLAGAVGSGTITNANGSAGDSNLTFNRVPDVIAKAAYEAKLGQRDIHLEAFGLFRDITDRVAYNATAVNFGNATNYDKVAGSVGFGIVAPLIPRTLDFQANGLIGRGIGSYGTGQLSDATFNQNGSPVALREEIFSGGLVFHATPSFDFYVFGGIETTHQSTSVGPTGVTVGYGPSTTATNGCFNDITGQTAGAGNNCASANKRVFEITGGVWDKLYKGQFGEVRVGVQYAYMQRDLFRGTGVLAGTPGAALPFAPTQNDHIVYTSLRYYPFQ